MQSAASATYLDDGGDGTGGGADGSKSIDRKKLQQVCGHHENIHDEKLKTPNYF
jgi:hypothetical protein